MKIRSIAILVLWIVLISCSSDSKPSDNDSDSIADTQCTNGEIRYIECNPGGGGTLADEDSHDDGGLIIPDSTAQQDEDDTEQQDETADDHFELPDEDTVVMQVLAISGLQQQICRDNQWLNEGECSDDIATAPCDDGEVRFLACGTDDGGMQKQICASGSWADRGSCVEGGIGGESDCDAGDELKVPCGSDSSGTGTLICEDHQWVMSECDTSSCLNGDIQIISCGQDSQGSQRRVCVTGSWKNDGSCVFNAASGDLLVAQIERNGMGITSLIEEFAYKTDGTDTWKELYRKKEALASSDPLTTYEIETTKTGAVLSRTTALIVGDTVIEWREEEWGIEGVMPLEDGSMPTDGRTRFTRLDRNGVVISEELLTYDVDGNIITIVRTYLDGGPVDRTTFFGTGELITKTESFTAEGIKLSISVRDLYGNIIMKEEQLADGRDVENYLNVHNASLNDFYWTMREFDGDENITSYKEKSVDGGALYTLTYSYADGHITQEKCATPLPERKACTQWGLPAAAVGNYAIAYTYDGEVLTTIEKSAQVDGKKEIISKAIFATAPPQAVGKIESYFTAIERTFCQHKFTNWEDRNAVDYLCDSTDAAISTNGLIHSEKWTWDVQGRLLTKIGKIDPDAPTDKTYKDSYGVTNGADGKTDKVVYTNNYNVIAPNSIEYHYTWVGNTMNEKKYTVASAVPTFVYNYAITYTKVGDLLKSVEMKQSSEDGVTVNAWNIYEYNTEGYQIKHIEKRADGTVYIEREWFDTHEVSGATRMAVDGTTVIETYSYATPGIVESSFCEAEGCTAPILAHGYALNGIPQHYWNELYTYDSEGRKLSHKIDAGTDDGTGTVVQVPNALSEKYEYNADGIPFIVDLRKEYPDCWTTPGVWDDTLLAFGTHSAILLQEKHRLETDGEYTPISQKATWLEATIEVSHTFIEVVYGANGPIVASCHYENCFASSLACKEAVYLGISHDNASICNNAKATFTYDDDGNEIKESSLDSTDAEWDVRETTWQEINSVWVILKSERKVKGYTISMEEYNDKGQLIEEFNDAPHGINSSNDPNLKFSHIKYEYDEHNNLAKEIYLNRADEEYRFILHDNRYNSDDQLEMIMRKDQDGRILGSTQMLYGSATTVE
ncbi:hypothetical protein KAH37_09790 [bacterium]|nr:hypothetical protein [bacterium]